MTAIPVGYQYADCKLLQHSWDIVPSDWTPQFGVPMTCRCERCGMERRDTVGTNTGRVESRRYVAPPGYAIRRENDIPPPKRDDFRLVWLQGEINKLEKRRRK